MLHVRPAAVPNVAKAPAVASALTGDSHPYGGLFDPRPFSGSTPVSLAQSFPLEAGLESNSLAPSAAIPESGNDSPAPMPADPQPGESAPLPPPRPAELASPASHGPFQAPARRLAQQNKNAAPSGAASDNRTIFDKLFGLLQPSPHPSGPVLAYAAPQDGAVSNTQRVIAASNTQRVTSAPAPGYDRSTAVYDVAAHTVYMPNGTRLEAHSGLGDRIDDPRYVNERNRGATPPNVYELSPREQLFHGVKALRLTPVGGGDVYGRTGLLAHRYMLGPHGDSNGCVSFKDYNAFLQAFENGEVKRLVVVARRG